MTGLFLAVLILGTAGSDGLRSCPHHGGGDGHVSLAPIPRAATDAPAEDSGPCDHDLGVCETLASDPDSPRSPEVSTPGEVRTDDLRFTQGEVVSPSDPPHLLPFSTGPPSHGG